jgi:hypothetical protein
LDGGGWSPRYVPICVSGSLSLDFHGSGVTGCALRGLCRTLGSESWIAQPLTDPWAYTPGLPASEEPAAATGGELLLVTFARGRRRFERAYLELVSVDQVNASVSSEGSECADSGGGEPNPGSVALRGKSVEFGLGSRSSPWIGTRCAGPLQGDLERALPVARIPLATILDGHATLSLDRTRSFSAGGFAGTASSLIVVRFGRAHVQLGNPSARPVAIACGSAPLPPMNSAPLRAPWVMNEPRALAVRCEGLGHGGQRVARTSESAP